MKNDAPEQIGEGTVSKSYESHAARVTISGTEYIRADHAQAELQAAVAAEREAWAIYVAQENIFANDVAWCVEDLARDIRAARDARVRADALRGAKCAALHASLANGDSPLELVGDEARGFAVGISAAYAAIAALIPADQEGDG